MKYGIKEITSTQGKGKSFVVFDPKRESKEGWMFQAYILGFAQAEDPVQEWIDYACKKYSSVKIGFLYYISQEKQMFIGPKMPILEFGKRAEAQAFAKELNEKSLELGLS